MIWVCRAGQKSKYIENFIKNDRIFLPWDGFNMNLGNLKEMEEYRNLVSEERNTENRTTISNLAAQLKAFSLDMNIDDYVLIPHQGSRKYTFARICGDYEYNALDNNNLWHSRKIQILKMDIPREAFSQSLQYSLGAFRTIFRVKNEEECIEVIDRI